MNFLTNIKSNVNQKYKYLKYKKKYNLLKNQYNLLKNQYGSGFIDVTRIDDYILIGSGYNVKVYIDKKDPRFVYKIYKYTDETEKLAETQFEIQKYIQENLDYKDLKKIVIPKLYKYSFDPTENEIYLKFDRIFNINDIDPDKPEQMINIILSNNITEQSSVAGRGIVKNLNYVEEKIGVYQTRQYLCELGQLFARLNYELFIQLDDIEIVFGKSKIQSLYKLFVIDFDRCSIFNIKNPEIKKKIFDGTYAKLGLLLDLRNYIEYDKLSEFNKINFKLGYVSEASKYGVSNENAIEVLNNLRK